MLITIIEEFEYCRECPAEELFFLFCSFQESTIFYFAFFFCFMKADHKHMVASISKMDEILINASYLNNGVHNYSNTIRSHIFVSRKGNHDDTIKYRMQCQVHFADSSVIDQLTTATRTTETIDGVTFKTDIYIYLYYTTIPRRGGE